MDMADWSVLVGDCREVMAGMEADSVDSIVTDPPYGLSQGPTKYLGEGKGGGFMGKEWDHGVPGVEFWEAALSTGLPGTFRCFSVTQSGITSWRSLPRPKPPVRSRSTLCATILPTSGKWSTSALAATGKLMM